MITYPQGSPVQHKRRRKLAAGWSYDSRGCLLSPRRQLVFKRRDGRQVVYVEGDMVGVWDAMAKAARNLTRVLNRAPNRKVYLGVNTL